MSYNPPLQNQVLLVPPLPPNPVNLFARSALAIFFSILATLMFWLLGEYPSNAPLESFFSFLTALGFWGAGITLGIMSLVAHSKRVQFNNVVLNYTNISGDQRYLPYMIKSSIHPKLLLLLSVLSFGAPILFESILGAF